MRKEDCFLNATQIITLADKNDTQRKRILSLIRQKTTVEVCSAIAGIPYSTSWVNFQHGRVLCSYLGLEQELEPLIDYGLHLQYQRDGQAAEPPRDYLTEV